MKIRIEVSSLASRHQSGVAAYTALLTEALAKHGDTVRAHYFDFAGRQPEPKLNENIVREKNSLVPLRVYAKAQSYNIAPPFDILLPQVDLTIHPNFATWPTIKSKKVATVVHDLTYLYYPDLVEEKNLAHLRRVVPRTLQQADYIITVSEAVKAELIKEFNINPAKCIVTPVPPDEIFKKELPKDRLNNVRAKYGLGDRKYIFFLGNFEPRKNLKTLVQAYLELPKDIQDEYSLVLAGNYGWKFEETKELIDKAINDGANIKHIGFIDGEDRPALYQAASVFAFPSLYEGFGIPVLEAMLSGCPVVASDIPVLRETGGNAALYANPHNSSDLAEKLLTAIKKHPYSNKDMQANAARFSWNKNIENLLSTISLD